MPSYQEAKTHEISESRLAGIIPLGIVIDDRWVFSAVQQEKYNSMLTMKFAGLISELTAFLILAFQISELTYIAKPSPSTTNQ
ncbi:hypothetical protein DPMN_048540 [Dreissena polymorpha]|uniref:Uncharacterized protein n=1 Tax=Dreissena polymorpha TaxID=45954 RepID=A0A9D4DAW0_DREPO|nr:hypothetical protein DPMN_048540 [Dreissena polymorpha]